jgi:hypothetical protein
MRAYVASSVLTVMALFFATAGAAGPGQEARVQILFVVEQPVAGRMFQGVVATARGGCEARVEPRGSVLRVRYAYFKAEDGLTAAQSCSWAVPSNSAGKRLRVRASGCAGPENCVSRTQVWRIRR